MRRLERLFHLGWRWRALFALAVVLPAIALSLLSIRAFQGESNRAAFQRRERQPQILRLLETDLREWVLARPQHVTAGDAPGFDVRSLPSDRAG